MNETTEDPDDRDCDKDPEISECYAVLIGSEAKPVFAICQTIMVIDAREGLFGIPAHVLSANINLGNSAGPVKTIGGLPVNLSVAVGNPSLGGRNSV